MYSKIIRSIGLITIFLFASISMLLYQFERDILASSLSKETKNALTYPSYLENIFYDHRLNVTLDRDKKDPRFILAAIDEISLKEYGRFPWSRKAWIPLLNKLEQFGVKVVAFDVVFSENERFLEGESPDKLFAKSIEKFQQKGSKVIIPFSLSSNKPNDDDISFSEIPDDLYNFIVDSSQQGEKNLIPHRIMSTTYPIKEILQVGPGLSYIGIKEDPDGVYRKYPLVTNVDSIYFYSFALQIYEFYTGDKTKLIVKESGDAILKTKNGNVFLNNNGETKVNWLGGTDVFPRIGIKTIVESDPNDEKLKKLFKDSVVFIGSTSFGAHDHRHSPIDSQLPGVYFHMNVAQMLTTGRLFQSLDDMFLWSWGILIVGFIGLILISLLKNAIFDAGFIISYGIIVFILDIIYLLPSGYTIAMFFAIFPVIAAYIWDTALSFYLANKDRRFLKQAFGNYISPELIDMMYSSGKLPELGGQDAILTAFFTDIQSFSTFSEKLTAKQLVELLNEYLTEMTDILIESHGTLDKYEGDAIIAFFGAPVYFEDHAKRACHVALEMQEHLKVLREKWISEGDKWPLVVKQMQMRIGLNTGEIVTGNMGSRDRMNYTMMGDTVNLAARLEEAAKQYGIYTHITKETYEHCRDSFDVRELDTIRVVGKSEPVTTYELIGEKGTTPKAMLEIKDLFEKGLKLYKNQQWDEAIIIFKQCDLLEDANYPENLVRPTNPSKVYILRCEDYRKNSPGKDWDGVYTLTSK